MKKILGIVGSLRETGNSEVMIKQICRDLGEPHQLQLLRLPDFKLKYCNGCYRCLMTNRGCVIRDDLAIILDAIAAADGLIFAVPTYFLAAHACLKVFIDRGISFYADAERLWGKPAVGLGIAGIEGKEGSTLLDIERFFYNLLAQNKGSAVIYAALPGEAVLNERNRQVSRKLAAALFAEPVAADKSVPRCSFCGGEAFRFEAGNRVRCMLCSEAGRSEVAADGRLVIKMEASEHPFHSSVQDALKHRDWLRGMVGRFKQQKTELARVRAEFADDHPWVKRRPD